MTESLRTELCDLPLTEVASRIERRELSPVELTALTLQRIEAVDPKLNAVITVLSDSAMAGAKAAEAEILNGEYRGTLHGIPITIKDLFATAGIRTTAGSRILADNVPDENATVVERLLASGAILVGKTNMLEFAYGSMHPDFGPTANPWDFSRSAAGSSSGSAAAVAAGMGFGSIGSDTGGSIRLPASYCGVVGLKPTYGLVSRYGAIPVSWSCDHMGPIARSTADCAVLLQAIAGPDSRDAASSSVTAPNYLEGLSRKPRVLRIGKNDAYLSQHVDAEVQTCINQALSTYEALGFTVKHVDLPPPSETIPALLTIITAEATAYHLEWLRSRPSDYSAGVRERLELGAITPAVSYIQAQRIRQQIVARMLAGMADVDFVAMPTSPVAATPLDEDLATKEDADPELLASMINFTGPFDLCGFPAISIPCGFTANGLPVGLQLVAKPFQEAPLFAAALRYEEATSWHCRLPTAVAGLLHAGSLTQLAH